MLVNYVRVAFRNIQRSLSYAAINIFGLSLGICCTLLIYLLIAYHLDFDTFHTNGDRIYRFVTEEHRDKVTYVPNVPPAFGKAFRNDYPYGEKVARLYTYDDAMVSVGMASDAKKFKEEVAFCDPEFFQIFNFPLAEGASPPLLANPHHAVITEKMAAKYFGNEPALGKTLRLDNKTDFQITGVLKDLPEQTDLRMEIFLPYANVAETNEWIAKDDSWGGITSAVQTFVLLKPGIDPGEVEKVLPAYVKKFRPTSKNVHHYKLQPLADIHFNSLYHGQIAMSTIWILGTVGFLLIFTACLNFINLSTARAAYRAKEVGIRKALGSARVQLFWQFTLETLILVIAATTLAIGAALAFLPSLNVLFGLRISSAPENNPDLLLFIVILIAGVTFMAGAYPGLLLSGFKPVTALKGKWTGASHRASALRRALIITQFTISQILLIGLIVVTYQMQFNNTTDMGFEQDGIVLVPAGSREKMYTLKNELRAIPGVELTSLCFSPPASYNHWGMSIRFDNRTENEDFQVSYRGGDEDYLAMFGIDLIAGRNLMPSDTVREFLVNEEFCRKLDMTPDQMLGKTVLFNGETVAPVVGVVADFHDESFRAAISPVLMTTAPDTYNDVAIRIRSGDLSRMLANIEKTWSGVYPDQIFSHTFVSDQTARFYENEQKTLTLVSAFSFIALLIGCLGLYGLVSYMSVQKTKEIGIRKALGANISQILTIFGKEFALLTSISFIIATPLGAWIMNLWLAQYVFKISLTPWIFLLEFAFVLFIVMITTGIQSLKAAMMNPVHALRSE